MVSSGEGEDNMIRPCFGCAAKVTQSDEEIEESIKEQLALEFNLVADENWLKC